MKPKKKPEKKKPEKKRRPAPEAKEVDTSELSEEQLGKVAGGTTNILNMKHESLKGIAQNLRG